MCNGLGQNDIVKVGKNCGLVISCLWTRSSWNYVGDPSYFPMPLPDCLCHVSFSRYLPLSLEIVENLTSVKVFRPSFFRERWPQHVYDRLLARPAVHSSAKCGWVPFGDLRLRRLAMKWNADFTEGGWKLTSNLKQFVDQSSCRFETM